MSLSPLEPGIVLAERFRMDASAEEVGPGVLSGIDLETQAQVIAFEVPKEWIKPVRPGVGTQHLHLAALLGDVVTEGRHVLVAERVPGPTLAAELEEHHSWTPVESVKCALRMTEAIETLHAAGAAHGFVHPMSVVVAPSDRSGPVLTWAPPSEALLPHRSPERSNAGAPSFEDDAWAVAAVLHQMLTGAAPPVVGVVGEADLETAGLEDPMLRGCLATALAAEPEKRSDLHHLKRELARWFVGHAGEQPELSPATSSIPPPLPAGSSEPPPGEGTPVAAAARPSTRPPPAAPVHESKGKRWIPILAVAGIVVGVGAAWAVTSMGKKPEVQTITSTVPAKATEAPLPGAGSATQVSLAEQPVTSESQELTGDKTASCVAAHLPKGAFNKSPSFDWLCSEKDPREGGGKLRTAVVAGAGGAAVTDAMRVFSKLGWYEMAAFAMVRSGCCPAETPAIELPEPAPGCDPMVPVLLDLAKAVTASQSLDASVERASRTFACEAKSGRASMFRRTAPPASHEAPAFRELVKSLATE